jgi:integrase
MCNQIYGYTFGSIYYSVGYTSIHVTITCNDTMNHAQLKSLVKTGIVGMTAVDKGLYIRLTESGTAFWVFRYTANGKRKLIVIGKFGRPPEGLSLAEAKDLVAQKRADVRNGLDPLAEKKRSALSSLKTVDDLADDWLSQCDKRLENPQIPRRVYNKEIRPIIGELTANQVRAMDIITIVRQIAASGRPSISNDALMYLKQLFNHAIKLGLVDSNPALPISIKDAGGIEKSRTRTLSFQELAIFFDCCQKNSDIFTRDNYIAALLLVSLGIRKTELTAAKWSEFDLDELVWRLGANRTKTSTDIRIPIPSALLPYLQELKARSFGSEYLFPNRRASKRRDYISDDTLNHALNKMFGKKVDSLKKSYPNILGDAGLAYFVIHDLRRTCRSLLAELKVPPHIAERCLNHKLKGVEGIYDRYDYFDERTEALNKLVAALMQTQ